jgi:hypothetical protein
MITSTSPPRSPAAEPNWRQLPHQSTKETPNPTGPTTLTAILAPSGTSRGFGTADGPGEGLATGGSSARLNEGDNPASDAGLEAAGVDTPAQDATVGPLVGGLLRWCRFGRLLSSPHAHRCCSDERVRVSPKLPLPTPPRPGRIHLTRPSLSAHTRRQTRMSPVEPSVFLSVDDCRSRIPAPLRCGSVETLPPPFFSLFHPLPSPFPLSIVPFCRCPAHSADKANVGMTASRGIPVEMVWDEGGGRACGMAALRAASRSQKRAQQCVASPCEPPFSFLLSRLSKAFGGAP